MAAAASVPIVRRNSASKSTVTLLAPSWRSAIAPSWRPLPWLCGVDATDEAALAALDGGGSEYRLLLLAGWLGVAACRAANGDESSPRDGGSRKNCLKQAFAKVFAKFSQCFVSFCKFVRFWDLLGPVRTRSDAFACVRIRSEAFGSSDAFGTVSEKF